MKFSTKTLMMFAMIGAGSAMEAAEPMDDMEEDFSHMDNLGLDFDEFNDEEPSTVLDTLNRLRGRGLESKRKVCFKYTNDKYDFPLYSTPDWFESKIAEETEAGNIVSDEDCEANIGQSSKSRVCRKYTDSKFDFDQYATPNWTAQQVRQFTADGQVVDDAECEANIGASSKTPVCRNYADSNYDEKLFARSNRTPQDQKKNADQIVDDEECVKNLDTKTTEYCWNGAKPTDPEWYRKGKLNNNDVVKLTTRKEYKTVMEPMSVCDEKLKRTKYCFTHDPKPNEMHVRPERIYAVANWDQQNFDKQVKLIEAGESNKEMLPMEDCAVKTKYCVDYGKNGLENLKERNWSKTSWSHKNNYPKIVDMQRCEDKKQEEAERKAAAIKAKEEAKAAELARRAEERAAKDAARKDAAHKAKLLRDAENASRKAANEAKAALRKDILVTRDLVRAQAEIDKYVDILDAAEDDEEEGELLLTAGEITEREFKQLKNAANAARKEVSHVFRIMEKIQQALQREAESQAKKAARAAKNLRQAGIRAKMKAAKIAARNKRKKARKPGKFPKIDGACFDDHVCARVSGDPHITTFDGLRYDCQGHGEFVLARSLESQFEIQGRFEDARSNTDGNMITITKAISIDTGVEGAPAVDIIAEEDPSGEKGCFLNYYIDGEPADFSKPIPGLELHDDTPGQGDSDLLYFPDSGITYSVMVRYGNFGCVLNNDICIPGSLAREETIVGLFGSPNGNKADDWMDEDGLNLNHFGKVEDERGYTYCTENWCVSKNESIFGYLPDEQWEDFYGCDRDYNPNKPTALIAEATDECNECCGKLEDAAQKANCLLECVEGDALDCENFITAEATFDTKNAQCEPDTRSLTDPPSDKTPAPTPDATDPTDITTDEGFVKGDPHFKTFGGELYDYHGECDLVFLHNPEFKNGLGMDIHIRTKIEDFWSSVESAAIKIGDETLEIKASPESNEWLWINGELVTADIAEGEWSRTSIGGMLVRFKATGPTREANIYIEGDKEHLVLKTFKNFVRVDVAWKESENFNGSTGLLGSHSHNGARLGRDGQPIVDVNSFGQEWQVAASDPQLFHSYEGAVMLPNKCVLPPAFGEQAQLRKRRLANGMDVSVAEKACQHLSGDDFKACVFDVIATQDTEMAAVW